MTYYVKYVLKCKKYQWWKNNAIEVVIMKKVWPSILLSIFSLPIAVFVNYVIYILNIPIEGSLVILSCVISLNTISLIIVINTMIMKK